MHFFLLLNIKENILNNVGNQTVLVSLTTTVPLYGQKNKKNMQVNGNQNGLVTLEEKEMV